jgi:hypothetical protein
MSRGLMLNLGKLLSLVHMVISKALLPSIIIVAVDNWRKHIEKLAFRQRNRHEALYLRYKVKSNAKTVCILKSEKGENPT